jgi:hypothetical protein
MNVSQQSNLLLLVYAALTGAMRVSIAFDKYK